MYMYNFSCIDYETTVNFGCNYNGAIALSVLSKIVKVAMKSIAILLFNQGMIILFL